eukprot:2322728-Pyramimonas_sp.AAC.1
MQQQPARPPHSERRRLRRIPHRPRLPPPHQRPRQHPRQRPHQRPCQRPRQRPVSDSRFAAPLRADPPAEVVPEGVYRGSTGGPEGV